jgi:hypothetical protein
MAKKGILKWPLTYVSGGFFHFTSGDDNPSSRLHGHAATASLEMPLL